LELLFGFLVIVLDVVDRLLALNAYGFADEVELVARPSYR
jgi:hypothetical protein